MDETKELIIKPPFLLTTQMFVYMMLIVLCIKKTAYAFPTFFYDDYYGIKTPLVVFAGIIDVIAYVYALIGIYKTLERKPYGIVILKFSLVYILIQLTIWSSSFLNTYPTWWFAAVWFVFILSGIMFLLYLFRSKRLSNYIPKSEREFGKYGWFGIIIYIAVIVQYGLYYGDSIIKNLNSQKVAIVNTKTGEYYTDGYVKFKPLSDWKNDSIYQRNDKYIFEFSSPLHNNIIIGTVCMECKTRLDFYAVLQHLGTTTQLTKSPIEEIYHGTEPLFSGTLYYSTYTNTSDNPKCYRTYAVFVDGESYKVVYIIMDDVIWRKQQISDELQQLSRSLTFQLE